MNKLILISLLLLSACSNPLQAGNKVNVLCVDSSGNSDSYIFISPVSTTVINNEMNKHNCKQVIIRGEV